MVQSTPHRALNVQAGRSSRLLLAMLATILLYAGTASANNFISEPFNYTIGSNLDQQNGGIGFSGAWQAAVPDYTIASGVIPIAGLASTGNHVSFTENNLAVSEATRSVLNSGFGNDGTTTWMSFVLRPDNDPTNDSIEFTVPGMSIGKVSVTDQNFYSVFSGGIKQFSNVPIVNGTPVFVSIEFQFNPDPNANDSATVYFNPTPGLASPDVSGINASTNFASAIGNFFFDGANGAAYSFGLMQFGTSYADVAPGTQITNSVPEPTSLGLMVVGALALVHGISRRRQLR